MRGTHRLGILAASLAVLAIGAAMWLAGRRGATEVQHSASSDTPAESSDGEVLAGLGASATMQDAASSSIDLVATPGEIRGVLLDADGRSTHGVIEFERWGRPDPRENFRARWEASVETDRGGRFRWQPGSVPPPFWVRARATESHWTEGVQATPGGEPVVIRLRDRPSVRVTVIDPAGSPVPEALVRASFREHPGPYRPPTDAEIAAAATRPPGDSQARTDVRGIAVLPHPGLDRICTLTAECERTDRDDVGRLVMESWRPSDCTVTLPASYVVEGTVRDGQGRPFQEGTVAFRRGEGGRWETTDIAYDGTFRIAPLERGSVELDARVPDVVPPSSGSGRVVAAGSRDVILTVDLGAELVVQFADFPPAAQGTKARLTAEPWNEGSRPAVAEVDKDGTCRFRGLRPGAAYTVYLSSLPELATRDIPRIAYRPHVTAASSPVRIELIDGLEIRGSFDGEALSPRLRADVWGAEVRVHDRGVFVDGTSRLEGFVVEGLPPGEWTLEAVYRRNEWVDAKDELSYSTGSAVVSAGSTDARVKLGAMKPGLGPPARGE